MEDQPADSGDLTTDAEPSAQPTDAAETAEATGAAIDVTPQGSDVTTDVTEVPAEPPRTKARRRGLFRRRQTKTAEPELVSDDPVTEASSESDSAPRKPVGKAGRAAKAREPIDEVAAEIPEEVTEARPEETSDEPTETVDQEVPARDVILVAHRPAGRRLLVAAVAAGVAFVAAAAFAGATVQPYLADRAAVDTKLNVARTAANAITTLWTYTPDNLEALPDRAAHYLGGDFANEYRKYIDAIVAPNKQAQVTNTTQVMGAAVETLTPSEATAIVYTNSVATSPVTKNIPSLRYLSYRLTMERRDAKWLITRMSTVTSLDLTPQL